MTIEASQLYDQADALELDRLFLSLEQYHTEYTRLTRLIDITQTATRSLSALQNPQLSVESALMTELYLQALDVDGSIDLPTLVPSMEAYAEPTLSMEASNTALDRLKTAAEWVLKVLMRLWSRVRNMVKGASSNLNDIIRAAKDELRAAGRGSPVERTIKLGAYAPGLVTGFKLPGGGTALLTDLKNVTTVARAAVYDYPQTLLDIADTIIATINTSNRMTTDQVARRLSTALGSISNSTLAGMCKNQIGDDPRYKNSQMSVTKSNNWNDSKTLFFERDDTGDVSVGRLRLDNTYPGGLAPMKDTEMLTIRYDEAVKIIDQCDATLEVLKDIADGSRQSRLDNRVKAMQSSLNTLISVNGIDNTKAELIQSAISNFSVNITMPTSRILDMVYKAVRSSASAVRLSARTYQ